MRIVAAMSGGVDSSVCAALLVEEGHDVIGVHMKLHDAPAPDRAGHCCGLDDALDARRVAEALGIPFYVMNLRDAFRKAVMDDLADAYVRGLTPNPCVRCNGVLKFEILLARARALGADALATGHYARRDGSSLRMAKDLGKDQSYFLWPMRPAALERTLFPLGDLAKPDVRAQAERLGLPTAQKPESMEVCFLPDDDHARFVREERPDAEGAGEIVDASGRVLGHHDSYWRFTVGQRRGLGIAAEAPLYVLRVDAETRRVVVGPDSALLAFELRAVGASWIRRPEPGEPLHARIRHRGALLPCEIELRDDAFHLGFRAPARAVAPGQSVVVYAGDEVLGGGVIARV